MASRIADGLQQYLHVRKNIACEATCLNRNCSHVACNPHFVTGCKAIL